MTADNLDLLRKGASPVSSEGRYAGKRIETVVILERNPAGDLGNLALAPAGVPLPAEAVPRLPAEASLPSFVPPVSGPPRQFRPAPAPAVRPAPGNGPDRSRPTWNPVGAVSAVAPGRSRVQLPTMPAEVPTVPAPLLTTTGTDSPGGDVVECHDLLPNAALALGGQRRLAVASVAGDSISVSIIGDGPKVHRESPGYDGQGAFSKDYPRISNSKVPKINPMRLPNVSGNAYLIHTDAQARYYYVDTTVNNGGAFRIAKVTANR